ncbi:MAG: hypothetical protein AB7E31_10470 [Desulfitobacterium sp.]
MQRYSLTALENLPFTTDESSVIHQVTDKITLAAGDSGINERAQRL